MKTTILTFVIMVAFTTFSFGQDEIFARSYFLKAQEAYAESQNTKAISNLDKAVEYLGTTNAKIEALYVKIAVANKQYINAEKHLKLYFENADNDHSDYNDLVLLVVEIKEKAEIERKEKEEEEKRLKEYGMTVPFMILEEAPIYPGCDANKETLKTCFSKSVKEFIDNNFDKNLADNLGLSPGKKRIFIGFRVNIKGEVSEIQVRAPHPRLKTEFLKILKSLPKMKPAKQRGNIVGAKYSLPYSIYVN